MIIIIVWTATSSIPPRDDVKVDLSGRYVATPTHNSTHANITDNLRPPLSTDLYILFVFTLFYIFCRHGSTRAQNPIYIANQILNLCYKKTHVALAKLDQRSVRHRDHF